MTPRTASWIVMLVPGVALALASTCSAADVCVISENSTQALRYDGATGAFLGVCGDMGSGVSPGALTIGPADGYLYLTDRGQSAVLRFDSATGAFIDVFVQPGSGGLRDPIGIGFGPDGNLYVSSKDTNSVLRFDGGTGAFIDVFVQPGSGGLNIPGALVFTP